MEAEVSCVRYQSKGTCKYCLRRDLSDLDSRFRKYYKSQERVEVTWEKGWEVLMGYGCRTDGRKLRFYVGMSTGWRPTYIMLLRRDSPGGMAIGSADKIKEVKGLGIYKYH